MPESLPHALPSGSAGDAVGAALLARRARITALRLSATVIVAFALFVLVGLGGWDYYTTPLAVRGYAPAHRLLRPSGAGGHLFGIAGTVMMLAPIVYSLRKKIRWLRTAGTLKTWLDVHVFCGIVGPVLVTFHTSFKFNGIVSVAYWLMIAVMLSGFVGRYLYVRIPRGLRGTEMSRSELDARAEELSHRIGEAALPEALLLDIHAFEHAVVPPAGRVATVLGLFASEVTTPLALRRLRHRIARAGMAPDLLRTVVEVIAERAALLRRVAYLQKTKALFDFWHVFHMPLVYLMFLIVSAHVAITIYLGYLPFDY